MARGEQRAPDRVTRPRQVALALLREIRAGDLADRALDSLARPLDARDYGWTKELVYGTLRLRGRVDHLLSMLVRGGVDALEPDVRDILRLGAYQILEMGSVPPYAAISQSVELARWAGAARASGLVNGVLHSLLRRRDELVFPDAQEDPAGFLAAWGSHPRWLIDRWIVRWGAEATRELVEANNARPELYLRLARGTREEAQRELSSAGIASEAVAFSPRSLRVHPPATALAALEVVPAVVQDPGAALVVDHAGVSPDHRVIDLCAAPGGKAVGLATDGRYVAAADLSLGRLRRLRENVERTGLGGRVGLVVADGRLPPFRSADVVLLDAPCTGTGTLRRHPDGRWRVTTEDLAALAGLQRELLDAAAPLVARDGVLVYSTCSLEPEENEAQVEAFLQRHPHFKRAEGSGVGDPALLNEFGDLVVLPQSTGVDGAYAARLRRTS
ncbi:MAG: 16S rRNA (cytosine(967)-C(5))-methyltransferase RsmB [Gemmatimonadetes bacterium]|nr:16S rRNA (cytosine(967)-C(5))-methyltransferase RsmB [Gemmatimonadota bacterium]